MIFILQIYMKRNHYQNSNLFVNRSNLLSVDKFIKSSNHLNKSMYQFIKTVNRFYKSMDWFAMSWFWFKSSNNFGIAHQFLTSVQKTGSLKLRLD